MTPDKLWRAGGGFSLKQENLDLTTQYSKTIKYNYSLRHTPLRIAPYVALNKIKLDKISAYSFIHRQPKKTRHLYQSFLQNYQGTKKESLALLKLQFWIELESFWVFFFFLVLVVVVHSVLRIDHSKTVPWEAHLYHVLYIFLPQYVCDTNLQKTGIHVYHPMSSRAKIPRMWKYLFAIIQQVHENFLQEKKTFVYVRKSYQLTAENGASLTSC